MSPWGTWMKAKIMDLHPVITFFVSKHYWSNATSIWATAIFMEGRWKRRKGFATAYNARGRIHMDQ